MDFEAFTIQEFLGIILIGFPIYLFVSFVLLEFIARIRDIFYTGYRKGTYAPARGHHHYRHYEK